MPNKETQKKYWCFTLNNPKDGELDNLLSACAKFIYQLEEGEEKTPHYQGFACLSKRLRLQGIKKLCPRAHFEPTNGTLMDNYAYCTKPEGVLAGPFIKGYRQPVRDPLAGKELRPFQREILDIVSGEPDDRTIHWYWETTGNVGKTSLCKSYCLRNKKTSLYLSGKAADMKCAISKFLENLENDLRVIFIDCPRTVEKYISWQGIEEIKNGIFFSGKYESSMEILNPPHIICFANFPPPEHTVSLDRWRIVNVEGSEEPSEASASDASSQPSSDI